MPKTTRTCSLDSRRPLRSSHPRISAVRPARAPKLVVISVVATNAPHRLSCGTRFHHHHDRSHQVLNGFLETFEVGGVVDGKVTLQEFVNYYQRVSSSIDDDDYFELMMRNAWHISGGEGWCANSANRRVLVTHPDGKQTVEEIPDDLGLRADDKAGMLRHLAASKGIKADSIELFGGGDFAPGRRKVAPDPAKITHFAGAPPVKKGIHDQGGNEIFTNANSSGWSNNDYGGAEEMPKSSNLVSARAASALDRAAAQDVGMAQVVSSFRRQLKARGVNGIVSMGRKFKAMCNNGLTKVRQAASEGEVLLPPRRRPPSPRSPATPRSLHCNATTPMPSLVV